MYQRALVAIGAISFFAHPIMAQQDIGPWRMHDWGWGWGGMWIGPLIMLILIGLVVALLAGLVQGISADRPARSGDMPSARESLDAR